MQDRALSPVLTTSASSYSNSTRTTVSITRYVEQFDEYQCVCRAGYEGSHIRGCTDIDELRIFKYNYRLLATLGLATIGTTPVDYIFKYI